MKENKNSKKEEKNKQILDLEQKCEELENSWKRAVADYQNLKRRTEEDRVNTIKYANFNLLQELLPVLDNFGYLYKHTKDENLKVTIKHFEETLKNIGIQELDLKGKPFDPNVSEAVEIVEGKKDNVVEVLQKGYLYNGKLLRPARVNVGKGK